MCLNGGPCEEVSAMLMTSPCLHSRFSFVDHEFHVNSLIPNTSDLYSVSFTHRQPFTRYCSSVTLSSGVPPSPEQPETPPSPNQSLKA